MDQQLKLQLKNRLRTGTQVFWLCSHGDEGRLERELKDFIEEEQHLYVTWDVVSGLSVCPDNEKSRDPMWVMKSLFDQELNFSATDDESSRNYDRSILIMRDLGTILALPQSLSLRRALLERVKNSHLNEVNRARVLILISDNPSPPPEFSDYFSIVDVSLPDVNTLLKEVVEYTCDSVSQSVGTPHPPDALKYKMASSMLGMTVEEAFGTLGYSYRVTDGGFKPEILECIGEEKVKVLRKIDGVSFVPSRQISSMADIGGIDLYREFVARRSLAFTEKAQIDGLDRPRGVGLLGPAGTGKTTLAKATAKQLGLDLVTIDIGSMFDSLVGSTEKKTRRALDAVTAMGNCVVLIDELDKVMNNAHGASGDSGTSSRVLSYLLNWLSERTRGTTENNCFVIVTMNRVANLPPELLRAGRFDRIFSVDLPNPAERMEIVKIHLKKRKIDPDQYPHAGLLDVVTRCDKYTGAELEEGVRNAIFAAYEARSIITPTIDELLAGMAEITPVAKISEKEITEIREFCREKTTPVSSANLLQSKVVGRKQRAVSNSNN